MCTCTTPSRVAKLPPYRRARHVCFHILQLHASQDVVSDHASKNPRFGVASISACIAIPCIARAIQRCTASRKNLRPQSEYYMLWGGAYGCRDLVNFYG